MIQAIQWDVTPELIDGWSTPNLYGLLFVTGLILGYFVIRRMFRKEGIPETQLDSLVLYMVIATIVGARLGHVFFYGPYWGPDGYLSNPGNIIKIWEGGLASHGGGIAILIALWIYSKKVSKKSYIWILDRIAAPVAIAGVFIRLGNLMNSEIVGKITDVPWGFKFIFHPGDCRTINCQWEDIPVRHPSQLYESIAYLIIFFILLYIYWKRNGRLRQGMVFGWFLILLFGARFLIEFTKIAQADGRDDWFLNTGQLLSIPFVLTGVYLLWRSRRPEALITEETSEAPPSEEKK